MLNDKTVLAVVPARSGSKGIPNKNMQMLQGISLIGWAGRVLQEVSSIDARIISTDSAEYAEEGRRYGLDVPFLRPLQFSTDEAGAVETMQHALMEAEKHYGRLFDVVLIIEPTSPVRTPADIERTLHRLTTSGADSVVTVSPLSTKSYPRKIFTIVCDHLRFFHTDGGKVVGRQDLTEQYYWRNGICYALTHACLMDKQAIITDATIAEVIDRPVVNIDDPIDLEWASFLLQRLSPARSST